MKRESSMGRAVPVLLCVAIVAALAGCGKAGDNPAQAASAPTATPGVSAPLPPAAGTAAPQANDGSMAPQGPAGAPAQPRFAQVVAVQPVTQSTTTSKPRQECKDEQVAVPETYKDKHQIGGAVAGGAAGLLVGSQIGGGKGKKVAMAAATGLGAYIGHEVQKKHQEDNATKTVTQNVCHTVTDKTTSSKTVGYDVTYILNGKAGHVRMNHNPGVGTGLPVENGAVVVGGKQGGSYYQ